MKQGHYAFEVMLGDKPVNAYLSDSVHLEKHSWNSKRHSNADYELHLILHGECKLEVAEDRLWLKGKEGVLIAPGHYHQASSLPGDFEHLTVAFHLPEGNLRNLLVQRFPVCGVFNISSEMMAACQGIFYEAAANNAFRREMLQALVTQLLLSTFRILGVARETTQKTGDTLKILRTDIIDQFFETNFASTVGEDDLAKELHISRRQLGRILKAYYGMGFREKLLLTRMDHAAWYLRNTDRKISEIAGLVGYASEAAFFQVFRKTFEMTPQQYRHRSGAPIQQNPKRK